MKKIIHNFMNQSLSIALKHPWLILGLTGILTLASAMQLQNLKIITDTRHLIPEDSVRKEDQRIRKTFGIKDTTIVAIVHPEDAFNVKTISYMRELSDSLGRIKGVHAVRTLFTEDNIENRGETVYLGPFLTNCEEKSVKVAREAAVDFDKVQGILYSSDLKTISLLVELVDDCNKGQTLEKMLAVIDSLDRPDGIKTYLSGLPLMESVAGNQILRDLLVLMPLMAIVAAIFLWWALRSWSFVLLCLIEILAVDVWTLGLMAYLGVPLYIILAIMPVILMGLAVSDEIHIFTRYREISLAKRSDRSCHPALEVALQMWKPVMLTSATTAGAFLAFLTTPMKPLRYFGVFTAFGVMVAMLFSLYVTPVLLMFLCSVSKSATSRETVNRFQFGNLGLSLFRARACLCVVAIVIATASAFGVTQVYIHDNWLHNFNRSSRVRIADEAISNNLAGSMAMHVEVDTGKDGGLKDLAVLEGMNRLQKEIEKHPNVSKTFSIVEIFERVHDSIRGDADITLSSAILGQYFFLLEGSSHEELWDFNRRRARIIVFVKKPEYKAGEALAPLIQTKARECLPEAKVSLGGDYMLCTHWVWLVSHDHLISLAVAGVIVFLITSVSLGSFRRGLTVVAPVAFAVLIMFGVFGFLGIPLGVATSMFGSIVLGLGIDYSIHFENEYQVHKNERKEEDRVAHSFNSAGKACFWDVVVVISSFSVLLMSTMPPIRKLGFIVSCTMLASITATYLLAPILLPYLNNIRSRKQEYIGKQKSYGWQEQYGGSLSSAVFP
jgi:predicted RND superfamily exporter protein